MIDVLLVSDLIQILFNYVKNYAEHYQLVLVFVELSIHHSY